MNTYEGYTFIHTSYGDTEIESVEFKAKDRETFLKEIEKEEGYFRNYHFTPSDFEFDPSTSFVFDKTIPGTGYEVIVITKIIEDNEETTMSNNKNIFKFFNKKEDPKYQKEVNQIRAGLEKLGTISCTDAELGQAWRDFSDECYSASFLIPDDDSIKHFAEWLDSDGAAEDNDEEE